VDDPAENFYAAERSADCPVGSLPVLPAWARGADFVVVALLLVALTVSISGGFRTQVGDWTIALTAPLRPLGLAVAIALIRLRFARQQSMIGHLRQQIGAWARSHDVTTAATVTLFTRTAILLVGYLAVSIIGNVSSAKPFFEFGSDLFNLQLRWDAGWYLQLARGGYDFQRGSPHLQQNIAFFPAYPVTVRTLALLFGNSMGSYVLAATVASIAFFFVALVYLYRLSRQHVAPDVSETTVWLLATYPFALFYGAIYTESLFLAGTLGAFYFMREGRYVRAGVWGMVVGLARPNGMLLSLPLALCVLELHLRGRQRLKAVCAAAMPGIAMLGFSAYIWQLTGSPFTWAANHAAWGRHYTGLVGLVIDRYQYISIYGLPAYVNHRPYDFLNGVAVLLVLASAWPVARRFSIAYAVFMLINILPPLSAGGLLSAGRLTAVLFPTFLWLGSVIPQPHRQGWIAGFAALQAFNAALFYTWRELF